MSADETQAGASVVQAKPGESKSTLRSIFLAAAAGAAGTAVVGLLFSSSTVTLLARILGGDVFPSGAIVFVMEQGCDKGWEKYDLAAGSFLVVAGNDKDGHQFVANQLRSGSTKVMLTTDNLPDIPTQFHVYTSFTALVGSAFRADYVATRAEAGSLGAAYTLHPANQQKAIEILPQAFPVTACRKKS